MSEWKNPWENLNPANIIGEPEHKAKWMKKLVQVCSQSIAEIIYKEALDSHHYFGSFKEAVQTLYGNEVGIAGCFNKRSA